MPLSHEHVGSKIVAKIKINILTRAELLLNLCYEIPCITIRSDSVKICLWLSTSVAFQMAKMVYP